MSDRVSESSHTDVTRYPRAIGFFDVSGSTTLWHETKIRDFDPDSTKHQTFLSNALGAFLHSAILLAEQGGLVFVNTTGDGFVVASHPTHWSTRGREHKDQDYHPCQLMYDYYLSVTREFEKNIKTQIIERNYVCGRTIVLRVGLHYGPVCRLKNGHESFFFGDALNYAARILDAHTSRAGLPACSYVFFRRFHRLGKKELAAQTETISDRNVYPEPIPVYNLHDPAAAYYKIERIRHYPRALHEKLHDLVFDVKKIRALLANQKVEPIAGGRTLASASYAYQPQGETGNTLVQFSIERQDRIDGNALSGTVALRIRHTGFEAIRPRAWKRELGLWNSRLQSVEHI